MCLCVSLEERGHLRKHQLRCRVLDCVRLAECFHARHDLHNGTAVHSGCTDLLLGPSTLGCLKLGLKFDDARFIVRILSFYLIARRVGCFECHTR